MGRAVYVYGWWGGKKLQSPSNTCLVVSLLFIRVPLLLVVHTNLQCTAIEGGQEERRKIKALTETASPIEKELLVLTPTPTVISHTAPGGHLSPSWSGLHSNAQLVGELDPPASSVHSVQTDRVCT